MHRSSVYITALSCLLLGLAAPSTALCYSYLLIDSRGTNQPQDVDSSLRQMIEQVMAKLPGGARHDAVYPATFDITQITTFEGSNDIENIIRSGHKECPEQKYALLGYSQGAAVTNHVLEKFSPSSPEGESIQAVVLIGNPYYIPHKQSDMDENCRPRTSNGRGILNVVFGYRIPDLWYETGKVLDICFTNDPVCNGANLKDISYLIEPSLGPHSGYKTTPSVQKCGADFIFWRLGATNFTAKSVHGTS